MFSHRLLRPAPLLLLGALSVSPLAGAEDCAAVVEATVAEVAAGAGEALNEERLALVRLAAGSACVKALSGRYGAGQAQAMQMGSEPVLATTAAPAANAEGGQQARGESADEEKDEGEDDALWPFGSFKINDVSASPSRKPYERRRD